MNEHKKKVLFFIPTLGQGGGERVVSELSMHFPETFESVLVLFENKMVHPFQGRVRSLSVPLSANFFLRLWRFFPRFSRFKKILVEEQPDVVITFGGVAATIALLLNIKPIVRVDSFPSQAKKGFWGFLYKASSRFLFQRARHVVIVSKAAAEDLEGNFGVPKEKIKVMYNFVDIQKIQKLSQDTLHREVKVLFEAPVIITMGRLSKEKNYTSLIKAFALVQKKNNHNKLVFLGEGVLQKELEQTARELGVTDHVHFLGWQENPYKFLAKAKVFVMSSLWEGFPMSIVEAMACGLPIVSTDCTSGPREILAPDSDFRYRANKNEIAPYGLLSPVDDEDKLAEALERVLEHEDERVRLQGKSRERVLDFDMKGMMKKWEPLLY